MSSTKLSTNLGNELKEMVKNQRISVIDLIVSFAQDVKRKQKIGSGRSNKGLYDSEIERIMKPYHRKGFERVIASDQLNLLEPKDKIHWVAVYVDADKDKSVEYYDSFGQEPTDDFMKQLKDLIDEINPDYYLKFKVNKVIDQASNSTTCGYHAIKFLLNRYNGIPFKESSGWSDITKEEKKSDANDSSDIYIMFLVGEFLSVRIHTIPTANSSLQPCLTNIHYPLF
ncbi:hypothetical protein DFA_04423 [Cavenderia fasciculata]|uniref:Ubiquitin-like protease family profile domain-containing protein n=1 Tax=Cavenderia fasciculata TaxID=261658 RepID=F4PPJ2_CACFS|nr:uncharacterized protein DFA_04423 [Cavenderia fasciculata]EGG22305.1 hypothetical protein DFA_04423 [Cavenderia fasciculata]|eukprot:XP_004360156.1 hypothetical protein DFA_04423 [Cavenderia fasciculata]